MNSSTPVTVAQHLSRVRNLVTATEPELLAIQDAPGRFLSRSIKAKAAIPAFNNSSMDGFVVHDADVAGAGPWTLPVVGEVAAGAKPQEFSPGGALRIMTGAPISVDPHRLRVIPTELTDAQVGPSQLPRSVTINSLPDKRHIRLRGEVVRPDDEILSAHTLVDAGCLAYLLNAGVMHIPVFRIPRIAVISSGDELVSAEKTAAGFEDESAGHSFRIADSNGPMITRLLEEHGPVIVERFHVGDGVSALQELLDELTTRSENPVDLVVTTGGISQGAFDVVKAAVRQSPNAQLWFGKVAQRPGSPQGAGKWNDVAMVTLPGNPVAAYVSALVYVIACLRILQGRVAPARDSAAAAVSANSAWWPHRVLYATPDPQLPNPRASKTQLIPVRLDAANQPAGENAAPALHAVPAQSGKLGSHFVNSLVGIEGLIVLGPAESDNTPSAVRVLR